MISPLSIDQAQHPHRQNLTAHFQSEILKLMEDLSSAPPNPVQSPQNEPEVVPPVENEQKKKFAIPKIVFLVIVFEFCWQLSAVLMC